MKKFKQFLAAAQQAITFPRRRASRPAALTKFSRLIRHPVGQDGRDQPRKMGA